MVNYNLMDPAIRELCRTINQFPGIITSSSCQGFVDGHRPGDPWTVHFRCRGAPSLQGYASIEFIVSMQREARAAGFKVSVACNAPPPALNGVCQSLYFVLNGARRHPTEFSDLLSRARAEFFTYPS